MVRLLGCFVENWMQICRAGAPINLSQHSFCRWLPQHKINCSYIHLQAFRIKSKGGDISDGINLMIASKKNGKLILPLAFYSVRERIKLASAH